MDPAAKAAQHQKGIEEDIKLYSKLKNINNSQEMNDFFDLVTKTVTDKLLWVFIGDNVKDWDHFCKVRGEIIALLYPIQEVRGADAMAKHLHEQLDSLYKNPVD